MSVILAQPGSVMEVEFADLPDYYRRAFQRAAGYWASNSSQLLGEIRLEQVYDFAHGPTIMKLDAHNWIRMVAFKDVLPEVNSKLEPISSITISKESRNA